MTQPHPSDADSRIDAPPVDLGLGLGRPVDRIIAIVAGLGLIASVLSTLWFFAGFVETDPAFSAASSAFLLSALLGAFAIIPAALVMRIAWASWRVGFRVAHGLWSLFLSLPWLVLALIAARSEWLPWGLSLGPLMVALPVILWAVISLILQLRERLAVR